MAYALNSRYKHNNYKKAPCLAGFSALSPAPAAADSLACLQPFLTLYGDVHILNRCSGGSVCGRYAVSGSQDIESRQVEGALFQALRIYVCLVYSSIAL